jgi:hypothetical protein
VIGLFAVVTHRCDNYRSDSDQCSSDPVGDLQIQRHNPHNTAHLHVDNIETSARHRSRSLVEDHRICCGSGLHNHHNVWEAFHNSLPLHQRVGQRESGECYTLQKVRR